MPRYQQSQRSQTMADTRRRLIEAAVQSFALKGYDGANINAISQQAGFAKGTIYNYFATKQALLLAVLEQAGGEHLQYVSERVLQEERPDRRLLHFFEAGFAFIESHPARARLLIQTLYGAHAEFREHLGSVYRPMFRLVAQDILVPGMQAGVFRQLQPQSSAMLIMTTYLGTASNVDEAGKPYLDAAEVADFVFRSIRFEDMPDQQEHWK